MTVTVSRFAPQFHWLDQAAVLARLDAQVTPDGAVAIFGDNSFWVAGNAWKEAARAVIQDFLGEQRRAGQGTFSHHDRPYSDIMRESPFSIVEEVRVPVERSWTTERILGYCYSTSFAAPHLFGDRLSDFEEALTSTLAPYGENGQFIEHNEFLIRIGTRT